MLDQRYEKLQKLISVNFDNLELLDTAFIHKSYLNEHRDLKKTHNERLEFLGDAVLELIVTDYLYKKFPGEGEGALTNWRSALVKGKHLAEVAIQLELGMYLYLSRGEERSGGRNKNYILANTLEALIGAVYLDQGYKKAHSFTKKFIIAKLEEILASGQHIDSKSRFQEVAQELLGITPEYHCIAESGPDHNKSFVMAVYLKDEKVAEGNGSSKQKAEQDAAKNGLKIKKWGKITLTGELN